MLDQDRKENYPYLHQRLASPAAVKHDAYAATSRTRHTMPFHFNPRRMPIDWRLLHGIDVNRMILDTDLDMLERVVGIVAFGDLDGEDTCNLTHLNFLRIFRLSQLTAEYLLHVQDHLARENSQLKEEGVKGLQHLEAVRLRVREQKELLTGANKELRRLKKTLKTFELLAERAKEQPKPEAAPVSAPLAPGPAPPGMQSNAEGSQQSPAALAPAAQLDPSTAWKLEKMEAQVKDMKEEREGLLQDLAKLKTALHHLAALNQGAGKEEVAAAVARTRREERLAADQRLTQALHTQQHRLQQQQQQQQQQQRLSGAGQQDSHMSVSVSESSEMQALQHKLAEALARQRDQAQQKDALELELIALKKSVAGAAGQGPLARRGSQVMLGGAAGVTPGSLGRQSSSTAAAAEVQADRLARELEEAEDQISAMSSKIRQQEDLIAKMEQAGTGSSRRGNQAGPAAAAVAAEKLAEQVQADLAQAEAELDGVTKDRDELQVVVDELEEKVAALELEGHRMQLEQQDVVDQHTFPEAVQRLQQQVQNLTEEVAALEDENRRLSEVIQADQPHNEELLLHVKELQHEVTVTRAEADEARALAEAAQSSPRMHATTRFGETFRSFLPAARTSSTVLEVEFHPDMSPRPGPLEQGALESPKKLEELDRQEEEEEALAQALSHADMGPGEELTPEEEEELQYPGESRQRNSLEQEYQEQAREARRAAREDAGQAAEEGNAVELLSAVAQRRLRLDMPHELAGHVRPGAMSRLPHTLQDYHATIGDIQDELQEDLAQEMATYNIDPLVEGMTDEQYSDAMSELARRREALMASKSPEEQRRLHAMRNNIMWHLQTVGSRMQRSGRLLPDGETSLRPQPVGRRGGRERGPSRLTSRPSAMTVTSLGGDTEAEEEQPPRRVTTRPQANPRRLFGAQSASPRPAQGAASSPRRAAGRPKRSKSQSSIIRQDLLAPVRPGHESEEDSASEAGTEQPARSDAGDGARAGPGAGAGLSLRRLGDGPRASPQRGAAALRDVREDFIEGGDVYQDSFMQGGAGQAQPRSTLRAVRPGMPHLRTGHSNVAISTQTSRNPRSPLTRGSASLPTSPSRRSGEGSRPGQGPARAGQLDRAGRVSGRPGLNRLGRREPPPPTPAPSPAGSPSIAAVYRPVQRSPEAQYRASRLRPIQPTKLRPLSSSASTEAVAAAAEVAADEDVHAGQQLSTVTESSPGQVEESQSAAEIHDAQAGVQEQVGSGKAQAVSDLVVESPLEAAKTTMTNPVFQQEADDVNGMEEVH